MFPEYLTALIKRSAAAFAVVLLLILACTFLPAQQTPPPTQPPQQSQGQQQQPPAKPTVPEAGGPTGDVGPIIIPKKDTKKEEPPPPPKPKVPPGMPTYTITRDVPLVQVPVQVMTKDGQPIPGLKAGNFKLLEDGVPQQIANFSSQSDAPITAVLLVEFANTPYYRFMYDALNAGYTFAQTLKKDDWIAVVEFDMKPTILVDFTQDKRAVYGALDMLRIPGFSEVNVFDAIYDTLDRVDRIEGRKYVVLITSGCDTFSKITFDKLLKKVKETPNVGIFIISTGEALRLWMEANGIGQRPGLMPCSMGGSFSQMDFLQADNEMRSIAQMTGGQWFKPRFEGEFPEIFQAIGASIRNQYVLAYHPSNPKLDGSYRKLKVQVVAPDGSPLKVKNEKGKDVKYTIIARDGYTARHEVE